MSILKPISKHTAYLALRALLYARKATYKRQFADYAFKRILVVETALLGDLAAATPLVKMTSELWPEAKLDVAGLHPFLPLVTANPVVHETHGLKETTARGILALTRELRRYSYDLTLCASPGVRNSFLALAAGRGVISGYLSHHSLHTGFFTDHIVSGVGAPGVFPYERTEHLSVRAQKSLLPVVPELNICPKPAVLYIDPAAQDRWLSRFRERRLIQEGKRFIVLHPTASWWGKQWPIAHFSDLTQRLAANLSDIDLVMIGSPHEQSMLKKSAGAVRVGFLMERDLTAAMALIKHCACFVGNDSGPKHLADGFGRPVVEILGPGRPETVGGVNPRVRSLYRDVGCNPCTQKNCKNDAACVKAISVDEVLEAIYQSLDW